MKIYGNIVDLFEKRVYKGFIDVEGKRIIDVRREENTSNNYILPGLIDSHIHIESSMLVPSRFAEAAVRHGTVAVISDPHEIANVMGMEGIDFMIENSRKVPVKFYFGAPSCVPATKYERSGGEIGIKEVRELLGREEVKYLSEMMNFPGVINGEPGVMQKLELAKQLGIPVDGHAPGLRGEELEKYIGAGITTDHESISIDEAREKIEKGMKIQIREGSAARSLDRFHYLMAENPDMLMICSDDLHPEMLEKGHINLLVKRLLGMGYDLFDVLRVAVLNPVKHYGLDTGLLRKGDRADFIVIDKPENFNIIETWIEGEIVYGNGRVNFQAEKVRPANRFNSGKIKAADIEVRGRGEKVRVIEAFDGDLATGIYKWTAKIREGLVVSDTKEDILKIVVKDRYMDSPPAVGFIRGFGLKRGAFGSSVAHDSHNIIAVGTDDESIRRAVNRIVEMKGGLAACQDEKCEGLQLEIGGIMSDVPCGTMAGKYKKLTDLVHTMGCQLDSPFMTLSFMALLVIPELKISDKGLFDGNRFEFVDLFI